MSGSTEKNEASEHENDVSNSNLYPPKCMVYNNIIKIVFLVHHKCIFIYTYTLTYTHTHTHPHTHAHAECTVGKTKEMIIDFRRNQRE